MRPTKCLVRYCLPTALVSANIGRQRAQHLSFSCSVYRLNPRSLRLPRLPRTDWHAFVGDRVLLPTYHCPTIISPLGVFSAELISFPIDADGTPLIKRIERRA